MSLYFLCYMLYEGLYLLLPLWPFDSGSRKRLPTHRLHLTIWPPDGEGAKVPGKQVYASETHSRMSSLLSIYHHWGACILDLIAKLPLQVAEYLSSFPTMMRSLKISFIMVWNVAGLLVSSKNMTGGLKRSWFVWKVTFHSSPSFIHTLLNPHCTSSLVKYFALQSWVMSSKMIGRG